MALLVASLVALPLLSGGETRAQSACTATATATVEGSDGVYTTTLACADTTAAEGAADYTHLPYYSQGMAHHRAGLPPDPETDNPITNNGQGNHLRMTIGNGVVFSGTNAGLGASDQRTIVLESEGDLTFTVEAGGVIRANQMLPNNRWNVGAGLFLVTDTGDLTVTHAGEIELDHSFPSTAVLSPSSDPPRPSNIPPYPGLTWNNFGSDGNGISVVAADRHYYAASTYDANGGNGVNGGDIKINLASTGVIRNKAGSAGGNGIDARQRTELGGIHIDLAAGSTIDVSAEGGRGVLGQIFKQRYYVSAESAWKDSPDPQSGDIIINARGTIKAAVKRKSGSRYQGAGIVALSTSSGAIRIASSGTIETTQAPAILAWPSGTGNPLDDPDTPAIEGNLIDVAGGRIETRGNSAIFAQFGTGSTVMTVRVAEGATVRAEGMAGPGAITKAQYESCIVEARLGCRYAEGARPRNRGAWWIRSDKDNNGEFDTIVPFVNGITVQGLAVPAEGAVSRVLIDGVVEVVEGSPVTADESDEELGYAGGHGVYLSHGGTVVVGRTGRISVSTASGAAIHSETGDLAVAVTGTVDGDIRGLGSGEHTVTVSEGGAVTGTTRLVGSGTVRADGAVGPVRLDSGGAVTVGATGRVGADSGLAIASGSAPPESPAADYEAPESDLTATISGAVNGNVETLGDGDLTATISGTVDGDVKARGDGNLMATISGTVDGNVEARGDGDLMATVSGTVNGDVKALGDGDLMAAISGMVDGGVEALGGGEHTVTVATGGAVSGTIHLAGSTVTVHGSAGCVVLDNGGVVNVGASGRISCPDGGVQSGSGDLTVDVAGEVMGDIRARGDGEQVVTVAEGGAVSGTVRLAAPDSDVTVDGEIGSAILDKGGMVTVGANGRVEGVGDIALSGGTGELKVVVEQAAGESAADASQRLNGRIVERGGQTAQLRFKAAGATELTPPVGPAFTRAAHPSGAFDVGVTKDGRVSAYYAPRARVYEALPSVLLGLAALPTHRDRMAAVRAPTGAWARIEAGGGERKAKRSESTDKLGYDHRHWGVQTGVDVLLGEDAMVGVSAHHRRGTAELSRTAELSGNDGEIEAAGTGFGVSGAWMLEDGAYIDAQVSATWFKADLESGLRGSLKSDAKGLGHAAGVEAGRRIGMGTGPLGELSLTPSLRLAYSRVDIDNFTDSVGSRVSLDKGRSMTGRVGVSVETAGDGSRLFGSLDVEQEFAPATRVGVSGTDLSSEAEPLRGQLEIGGAHVWDEGRFALQGVARYAAGRGGNRDYSGGLNLKMRF